MMGTRQMFFNAGQNRRNPAMFDEVRNKHIKLYIWTVISGKRNQTYLYSEKFG